MAKKNDLKDKIIEMIAKVLKKEIDEVNLLDQNGDLSEAGLDSITAIELVVAIETEFEIEFGDDELLFERLNTINKLFEIIKLKV